jgi:hypothetical protein
MLVNNSFISKDHSVFIFVGIIEIRRNSNICYKATDVFKKS